MRISACVKFSRGAGFDSWHVKVLQRCSLYSMANLTACINSLYSKWLSFFINVCSIKPKSTKRLLAPLRPLCKPYPKFSMHTRLCDTLRELREWSGSESMPSGRWCSRRCKLWGPASFWSYANLPSQAERTLSRSFYRRRQRWGRAVL